MIAILSLRSMFSSRELDLNTTVMHLPENAGHACLSVHKACFVHAAEGDIHSRGSRRRTKSVIRYLDYHQDTEDLMLYHDPRVQVRMLQSILYPDRGDNCSNSKVQIDSG